MVTVNDCYKDVAVFHSSERREQRTTVTMLGKNATFRGAISVGVITFATVLRSKEQC